MLKTLELQNRKPDQDNLQKFNSITKLPKSINWQKEVKNLDLEPELEREVLIKLNLYLQRMKS